MPSARDRLLRRVGHTGAAVDVSPLTILGDSLLEWWTADRPDLMTLVGAAVTNWRGTKNGYSVTQAISASRPTYSASSFNGSAGLTFDGGDDGLATATQPFPSGSNPSQVWAVVQQDALPANTTVRFIASFGGAGFDSQVRVTRAVVAAANRLACNVGTGGGGGVFPQPVGDFSTRHVVRLSVGATLSAAGFDGAALSDAMAAVPAIGTSGLSIGSNQAVSGNNWQGQIRDVLVTGSLSAEQEAALLAWALPRRMI